MSAPNSGLWFCHECQSEMHVEMHPDPICSVCHSSFVEQLDPASQDDPRHFTQDDGPPFIPDDDQPALPNLFNLLFGHLGGPPGGARSPGGAAGGQNGFNREFEFRLGPGTMRLNVGAGRLGAPGPGDLLFPLPPSSPLRPRSPSSNNPHMPSPTAISDTFQQYILALLNGHDSPLAQGMATGRMGDYVFTQEALDALMTQLMEGSGQHATRPASQEVRDALPRHTVSAGSELRTRDCAVCKDGFEVGQKTVALPCTHSFHDECILPWLELNGTCPVCRTPVGGEETEGPPQPPPRPGTGGNGRSPQSPRSPRSPRPPGQSSGATMPGGLSGDYWS